ncbi:hypothetical protein GFD17_04245 [Bifidobacterium sp. SMB2]|uniref:hypothetical protein n=1 Tax=Bifidobacterium sp. SMB2 TaxID=2661626 RepID=UPI0013D4D1D4|nr:hypothetical protein [Bifidobacterium sp. SMB2]NEG95981.1 hypothetical protein [Bifidobacterium sp. SMB2]
MNASNPWLPIIDTAVNDIIDDIGKVAPGDIVFLSSAYDGRMLAFTVAEIRFNTVDRSFVLYEHGCRNRSVIGGRSSWRFDLAIRPDTTESMGEVHD